MILLAWALAAEPASSTEPASPPADEQAAATARTTFHLHLGLGGGAHFAERHAWGPEAELLFEFRTPRASILVGFGGGLAGDGQRFDTRARLHVLRFGPLSLGGALEIGIARIFETRYESDYWQPNPFVRVAGQVHLRVGPAWVAVDPGVRLMQIIDYDYGTLGIQPGISARIGVALP